MEITLDMKKLIKILLYENQSFCFAKAKQKAMCNID